MGPPRSKDMDHNLASAMAKIIQTLGLPTVLLGAVLFAGWRFAVWASPMAEQVVETHVEFIHKAEANMEKTDERMGSIENQLLQHQDFAGASVLRILTAIENQGETLQAQNAALEALVGALPP